MLTEKNWLAYAAVHYDNPQCVDEDEFFEDLKRIKYLKKAISRYEATGELRERLVLNHLIILCNVFGPDALPRMLWLKMPEQMRFLKPFLILLACWPDIIENVRIEGAVDTDEVPLDQGVVNALRKI